jgi:hypothetical protein
LKRQSVQVIFTPPSDPQTAAKPAVAKPTDKPDVPIPAESEPNATNRKQWLWMYAIPPLIYAICYFALTFPNVLHFGTDFFCDWNDGLQNVWNLWWIHLAVTSLHCSPWFTDYLHFPNGTSLLGHTLNPLDGFLAIPLQSVFSLVVSHNLIEVFCFAASGTTAFWLARKVTDSYWPSLIAGYAFTFSAYHWAHGMGHMQLTAMEGIPLFLLLWIYLLEKPGVWMALAAAAALGVVQLCDFYYLFYCILAGFIFVIAEMIHRRQPLFVIQKRYLIGLGAFAGFAMLLGSPLPIAVMRLNARDPLLGAHPADMFYADLLAPLIPGQMWRFGNLTKGYWSHLTPSPAEMSVSLGIAILIAAGYAIFRSKRQFRVGTWLSLLIVFLILSLGRRLHIAGKELTGPYLPYHWLEVIVPPIQLSGCPSRMMVMATLAACILAAMGIKLFIQQHRKLIWPVGGAFLLLMIVESIPSAMPMMPATAPDWAVRLEKMPGDGVGVMYVSQTLTEADQLFAQTIFHKPIVGGYIARYPTSVLQGDQYTYSLLLNHQLAQLYHDKKVRYIITDGNEPPPPYGMVYEGSGRRIYDLSAMVQ